MKQRIEFYQAALKPSQDRASLSTLWQISLVLVLLWGLKFAFAGFEQYQLQQQNAALQASAQEGEVQVQRLQQTLADLKASQDDSEREQIERNIQARQQLLGLLQQKNLMSYATILKDLAHIPWKDVALQGLTLQGKQMVLRGEAANASAVPQWILGFEQRNSLRGHGFSQLAISEREQGGLSFSLYSAEEAQ